MPVLLEIGIPSTLICRVKVWKFGVEGKTLKICDCSPRWQYWPGSTVNIGATLGVLRNDLASDGKYWKQLWDFKSFNKLDTEECGIFSLGAPLS